MYTFKKEERLCNKRLIKELFNNGSSFLCYPFRVSWCPAAFTGTSYPVQVLIAVSKKRFKRAVDRNLIKRHVREAYRRNKKDLYNDLRNANSEIIISINYIGEEVPVSDFIQKKIKKLLALLVNAIK